MRGLWLRLLTSYLFFWARLVLRQQQPRIVGITGSVGKTTTKEVVAAVLAHPDARATVGRVRKTAENLNGNIGLPLVVLNYDARPKTPRQWLTLVGTLPFRALRLAASTSYPEVLVSSTVLSTRAMWADSQSLRPRPWQSLPPLDPPT